MSDTERLKKRYDVTVIGAGPAGTITAALLNSAGLDVAILERTRFPRFVIGESLLPICNDVLTEAGLFDLVNSQGYQVKTGAVFVRGDDVCELDFSQQFADGTTWTWQVPRAEFDNVLAEGVQEQGVPIFFEHTVEDVVVGPEPLLTAAGIDGSVTEVHSRMIVDASGYGRVLPNLLGLNAPSDLPVRHAVFTHVEGDRRPAEPNAGRIYVIVHRPEVWIWLIPFSNTITSVGVVASPEFFAKLPSDTEDCLRSVIAAEPLAAERLGKSRFLFKPRRIEGYSVGIARLWGDGYCLVGNATEFLDPVFSSGVALAMQSASQAAKLIIRQLAGEAVDWEREYGDFMMRGINTFRTFVNAWYNGDLQKIFFAPDGNIEFKQKICSALAGYVWDLQNPFVRYHKRKIRQLVEMVDRASG